MTNWGGVAFDRVATTSKRGRSAQEHVSRASREVAARKLETEGRRQHRSNTRRDAHPKWGETPLGSRGSSGCLEKRRGGRPMPVRWQVRTKEEYAQARAVGRDP